MTTNASAIGPSSVMVMSILASCLFGVMARSRVCAPPVSAMVGRPEGRLTTPMSRKKHAGPKPGGPGLGTSLLSGETLCIGLHPPAPSVGGRTFDIGEDSQEEALAMAGDGAFDTPDVHDVGTEPKSCGDPAAAVDWRAPCFRRPRRGPA